MSVNEKDLVDSNKNYNSLVKSNQDSQQAILKKN
jgi:hypothetical protein